MPEDMIIFTVRMPKALIIKLEKEMKEKHVGTRLQMMIDIIRDHYEEKERK